MKLKNIDEQFCKTCNSDVIKESRINKHANGFWNEERVFLCGKELQFIPNIQSLVVNKSCPYTLENIEKETLRTESLNRIEAFIEKLNVDKDYKEYLLIKIKEI